MSALAAIRQHAILGAILTAAACAFLANRGQAATHYYFDINGTTAGSGVGNNGSYTWEGTKWNANAAGTGSPIAWPDVNEFPEFAAGTDAGSSNYTITANSSHVFAGMALQASGGGTVTLASGNSSVLTLVANTGGQGIFVGGASTQNLVITAPIGGNSTTPLVWQGPLTGSTPGSLFLYGNNTFSGGVDLNTTAGLNFNNNNSFGTGPIRWGFDANSGTQFSIAAPAAPAPITIPNAVVTKAASTLIMSDFAKSVTFSGGWSLASGTSTLDIRSNATPTISGIISGSGGALNKISTGTLILSGANTYSAGTTISAGTIELSGASAKLGTGNVLVTGTGSVLDIDSGVTDGLGDSSTLTLSTNAKLNLDANVNEKLGTLMLDGAPQPNGTYGSSQSSAANKLDLYFTGTGVITVGPSILVGDYNSNGFVDAADYVTWRQNIGQPSQTLANDTTGVIVGNAQYALWRTGFGSTTPAPAGSLAEGGAAVPEPSSVGLLILALATLVAIGAFRGLNGFSKLSSGR